MIRNPEILGTFRRESTGGVIARRSYAEALRSAPRFGAGQPTLRRVPGREDITETLRAIAGDAKS
jgi:hypothetical protein